MCIVEMDDIRQKGFHLLGDWMYFFRLRAAASEAMQALPYAEIRGSDSQPSATSSKAIQGQRSSKRNGRAPKPESMLTQDILLPELEPHCHPTIDLHEGQRFEKSCCTVTESGHSVSPNPYLFYHFLWNAGFLCIPPSPANPASIQFEKKHNLAVFKLFCF